MGATRFVDVNGARTIEGDWYEGVVPAGVRADESAYIGSSYSFERYRSERPVGVQIERGASLCDACSVDVGPHGRVRLGEFALVTAAHIVCDAEIDIGAYALVSWDVLLIDSYRTSLDPGARARVLRGEPPLQLEPARPIRLGRNSWVGFGACVLPGVTVGEGAIVAARSVVASDVPAYTIVAGNPARVVRRFAADEIPRP